MMDLHTILITIFFLAPLGAVSVFFVIKLFINAFKQQKETDVLKRDTFIALKNIDESLRDISMSFLRILAIIDVSDSLISTPEDKD